MVNFKKLKSQKPQKISINPVDIFRRLPKPQGVNDIYTGQTEILNQWFDRRNDKDVVLKLHTGGGKTLVGLLIAQSTMNEVNEPVLYLAPTKQLVEQTLTKAREFGIQAVPYVSGEELHPDFKNGKALMVSTYNALFNGKSKFGVRGDVNPQKLGAIILDDAHAAFPVIRDSLTLEIKSSDNPKLYTELVNLFRQSFKEIDKLGTLDDVVAGIDYSILEVPYWSYHEQLDVVREYLRSTQSKNIVWPLLRDNLHLCHALISKKSFTFTPILPMLDSFPTFYESPRRIFMSATIADDSEIIRTFDADQEAVKRPLQSRSLAGISERMILIPGLQEFKDKLPIDKVARWVVDKRDVGTVILSPSDQSAKLWAGVATIAKGSESVKTLVDQLQAQKIKGPVVLSNRYDGIDLPGDSCRVLIIDGLPKGTSNFELYKASALYGGTAITRMLAQRIEQGMGRAARGAGDHCVVLLVGKDLTSWVAKEANFRFLTSATRAQLDMGIEITKEVKDPTDFLKTMQKGFDKDSEWAEYHAEVLADLVDEEITNETYIKQANIERKAINLFKDGYHNKAISKLEKMFNDQQNKNDPQLIGWLQQLAARIAHNWGNDELASDLQRQAFANNRNLIRPKVLPPYKPLFVPGNQAESIVEKIGHYRLRRGYLEAFEEVVSFLHKDSSANQFEESLARLGEILGFETERHDNNGEGPDILWLLPEKIGLVIEAKSRKKTKNPLNKDEHGQLLIAAEWFMRAYPDYKSIRVSVHPTHFATKTAEAENSYALTYEKLQAIIADTRILLTKLCTSQLEGQNLLNRCEELLRDSYLRADKIAEHYLTSFESN